MNRFFVSNLEVEEKNGALGMRPFLYDMITQTNSCFHDILFIYLFIYYLFH